MECVLLVVSGLQIATALPYMFQYDGEKYTQSPEGPTVDPSTGFLLRASLWA